MATKHALKNILADLSEDAKFCKFDFISPEQFSVTLKCKVDKEEKSAQFYNQYVSQWIKKFSNKTSTTWIVRNCFPNLKRLLYRKVYVCHRSSFNKVKRADSVRNQDCKAKIDFKMKFINRNTIKNDPLLRDGLNMTIFINYYHSHKIRTVESYNLLRSTADTDGTFYEYLRKGYSRGEAKNYHELTIIDTYSEKSAECLMNATINPSIAHVFYLYSKKLNGKLQLPRSIDDKIMAEKKANIIERGGCMSDTNNYNIVVVITPAMKRVIMRFELDHVLIDSTVIPNGAVATFIYVPSVIGALPIACILHAEQTEASYSQAFFTFKMLLENEINKNFDPKLLLIDFSSDQRNALEAIFSGTKIISSHLSMRNETWKWLCDVSNKIDSRKRHSIMDKFDSLLRAKTLEAAEQCYTALSENDYVESNTGLKDYIVNLWHIRTQWLMLDENINNDTMFDISIRLMKEFMIRRCKSFSIGVMVDVISNIVDNQQCKILNAYLNDHSVVATYTRFLPKADIVLGMEVSQISTNEFKMIRQDRPKKFATFKIDTWCCDCMHGKKAQFCEHLCGILNSSYVEVTNVLPDDVRSIYVYITGENTESPEVIKPEADDHDEEIDEVDRVSIPSSMRDECNDDYYYLEVKKEKVVNEDPLDEMNMDDNNYIEISDDHPICHIEATNNADLKGNYVNALKGLNDEFRRLNGYFKNNVNESNLETMMRLARELSKIRPVERVNLMNMNITLN